MTPNLRDIKLIAIDLDGTLLTDSREPHPRAVEAIQAATQAGITVVLASGRASKTLRPIQKSIGLSGPIVACNGAFALSEAGEILFDERVCPRVRDLVCEYGFDRRVQLFFYLQDDVMVFYETPMVAEYQRRVKLDAFRFEDWGNKGKFDPTKVLLMDEPENIALHFKHLAPLISAEEATITISEPVYLEFLPGGVTKATGLAVVATHLNLEAGQVAAIGDYYNDLEMLQWAGYSGAVDNAAPEVLAAVDRVFPSNNNGGVADFIFSIVYNL